MGCQAAVLALTARQGSWPARVVLEAKAGIGKRWPPSDGLPRYAMVPLWLALERMRTESNGKLDH